MKPASRLPSCSAVLLLTLGVLPPGPSAQDWPSFRGPGARGIAEGHALAEHWDLSEGEAILWRVPVPGLAHSSPVIAGETLFVTSAVRKGGPSSLKVGLYGDPSAVESEGEHDFVVLALDKRSGAVRWQRTCWSGTPKFSRHPKSSYAASTPATDGRHLVVNFGTEGLYCLDMEGELLWQRDLGDLDPGPYNMTGVQWGYASSPVIHEQQVLVQCDALSQGFLAAFDLDTGAESWRVAREDVSTWATPSVSVHAGRAQVICNGYKHIGGYDLASGKELWKLVGGGDAPVPAPVVVEDLVLITNAHGGQAPIYAISLEAEGEISPEAEAMLWCHMSRGNYMQTPLVYGEELYLLSDGGILACLDLATGEPHYRERLGAGQTGFTASMVAGDGKLYATSEEGGVHVVAAGTSFKLLARNELGETCMATPAVSDGVLFFRTREQLLAVAAK